MPFSRARRGVLRYKMMRLAMGIQSLKKKDGVKREQRTREQRPGNLGSVNDRQDVLSTREGEQATNSLPPSFARRAGVLAEAR